MMLRDSSVTPAPTCNVSFLAGNRGNRDLRVSCPGTIQQRERGEKRRCSLLRLVADSHNKPQCKQYASYTESKAPFIS